MAKNHLARIDTSMIKCKLKEFLLCNDSFGYPITLKHHGKPHFTSIFGGVLTLVVKLGIFIYALTILKQTVNKEAFNVSSAFVKRDLLFDNEPLKLDINNFDIAMFPYFSDPSEKSILNGTVVD